MSQNDLQHFLGQAFRDINHARVLMAVAIADKISYENLRRLLDELWPDQISRDDFNRYRVGPLLRHHQGLYYVHGAVRPMLIERFQGKADYAKACRLLSMDKTHALARLKEEAWETAALAALLELGFDPVSACAKLNGLMRLAPSREAADWLDKSIRTYSVPVASRR